MIKRRLEWFGRVKSSHETENIRAVLEMKIKTKGPRGRPKLQWKDTVRRDLKAWNIREEWSTDRERWKGLQVQDPLPRTGRRRRKVRNIAESLLISSCAATTEIDSIFGQTILIFRPNVIVSDKQAKTNLTCHI